MPVLPRYKPNHLPNTDRASHRHRAIHYTSEATPQGYALLGAIPIACSCALRATRFVTCGESHQNLSVTNESIMKTCET